MQACAPYILIICIPNVTRKPRTNQGKHVHRMPHASNPFFDDVEADLSSTNANGVAHDPSRLVAGALDTSSSSLNWVQLHGLLYVIFYDDFAPYHPLSLFVYLFYTVSNIVILFIFKHLRYYTVVHFPQIICCSQYV